jgi:hypothetical protein
VSDRLVDDRLTRDRWRHPGAAVATFASIRSANRSARISERAARTAEQSLLAGQRPLLVSSLLQDPAQ